MGVSLRIAKWIISISLILTTLPVFIASNQSYLQGDLPKIVLSKDEIFTLDLNDYFQMNSPNLDITNMNMKSQIDWQIKPQYNNISDFKVNFTLVKAIPISSSPYLIFLSTDGLYLYEFINSQTSPNLLQVFSFSIFPDFKGKILHCLDATLLDNFRMVVDCNLETPLGLDSVFFYLEIDENGFFKPKDKLAYHVEVYLDYLLNCNRRLYSYNNKILQYCKYESLMTMEGHCFQSGSCSNHIIIWEMSENKTNFLLILDEFTLNVNPQKLPLKIQEVLINWKTDTLMILELTKGVYQFNFSNLQLKQVKSIEFNDDNDTIYLGMEINKMRRRMPFIDLKHYLIVWSNKYCVEVLLKDSYEFYFAKRYDFHYFLGNYLSNSSNLLFTSSVFKNPKKMFHSMNLKGIQINNNFINLAIDLTNFAGNTEHYQMIFCRKQDRIAIHFMRRLLKETSFLRINFLYDEGDYYLEIDSKENVWRLIEITDLYLVLKCCPVSLINKIDRLLLPFKITNQNNPDFAYGGELSVTLIPLNYPHVLPATDQLIFQFEDPVIYIKLANIAIGPEIEFIYLSGSNENFRLTIDHIHQVSLDIDSGTLEKLLKCDIVSSWIDNENFSLRLVFKFKDISSQTNLYRFIGLECVNISKNYVGDCRTLPRYDSVLIFNPIDFYFETPNSMIYIHEVSSDHLNLFTPSQNFTGTLPLTPTKTYSIVLFSVPNLIFGIPSKNNSIEVYYVTELPLKMHQTEKILNIDAKYLDLSFDLNITQIDLTLIYEGIIIVVSANSENIYNLIVLQIVQSAYIPPKYSVRLASFMQIGACQILVLRLKKIILVCDDMITEMRLNNPFYVDKIRNYPLYRYNLIKDKMAFTDDKMIYVYATYYSKITLSIQSVLLVYDPSKTAASLLVTTINLASTTSLVCLQGKTELSLMAIAYVGDYVISRKRVREKNAGIFLNMITLQPALTGVFWFKNEEKTHNKKQNEKTFEINVSFTNENSNRDLVSTLQINMNLKDYNIFLSNHSLNNESISVSFSKKQRKIEFLDSNFFKGPIEDYEITNYKTDLFVLKLKDYLEEGTILADYQQSLYRYGLVLDMISTSDFIIVLSQYKLIIYQADDFPSIFYQENFQYQIDSCKLAHHNKQSIFLMSCFNSFDLILYQYTSDGKVRKSRVKIPNYVGLVSNLAPINDYLLIQTHLFNSLNETEFCVCEFPEFGTSQSLRVIGIINSEDFELINIKSQDFELLEIFANSTFTKFGLFIVQTFQILYLEISIGQDKTMNKSIFAIAANPYPARFTSLTIDQVLISPNETNSCFRLVGLIGTDEHLYELELEFDPYQKTITFGEPSFYYRKYCKCQNLANKPIKFYDYVARVCSYSMKEKDLTTNIFKEESKDLYHFIQVYKRISTQKEAHPIRVIKVLYSPEISKLFLFYRSTYPTADSLHLLTASYLNYLIDYKVNQWMGLSAYFLQENQYIPNLAHQIKIIAKNDFSAQDINVTVLIEGDPENNTRVTGTEWILGVLMIFLLGFALGIYIFIKQRREKLEKIKMAAESAVTQRQRFLNTIELGYVD